MASIEIRPTDVPDENTSKRNKTILFVPYYLVGGNSTSINTKLLSSINTYFRKSLIDPKSYPLLNDAPRLAGIEELGLNPYLGPNGFKAVQYCLKNAGVVPNDVEDILALDSYIKKVLGLDINTQPSDITKLQEKSKRVLDSIVAHEEVDNSYPVDVVMSNIEKPYRFYITDDILFVIVENGFGNLLLSNYEPVVRVIVSDIVREYQNKFGTNELHSSMLFNVYLKTLDRAIFS
jgi:hypothetical protein